MHEVERHLGEPLAGRGIYQTPLGINSGATGPTSTGALAVRLTRDLHPQVGIQQRDAGIRRRPYTKTAIRRVAPILGVRIGCCWGPRTLAVPARVNDEFLQPSIPRIRHPSLALDVVGIPLVSQGPGGEIVWVRRVILACAPIEVAVAQDPGSVANQRHLEIHVPYFTRCSVRR